MLKREGRKLWKGSTENFTMRNLAVPLIHLMYSNLENSRLDRIQDVWKSIIQVRDSYEALMDI